MSHAIDIDLARDKIRLALAIEHRIGEAIKLWEESRGLPDTTEPRLVKGTRS